MKTKAWNWMRQAGWSFYGPLLVVALFVGGSVSLGLYKGSQWREFKSAHNCQKVGRVSGDVLPTVSFNTSTGQPTVGVAMEADKVGWKCDDGVTYWR
ncbi:hypothetical protein [Variovorax sp. KK3]|uniref:hypothetical protein n=1 Tax=Variovorax sp. KK3 TaxID=1855728 RepID=UPI00097C1A30|nr:hypothetical protein [Variovorax sp. KK3]